MEPSLDIAPCGFLSFADNGTILAVNATLLRWLGYAPGTLEGQPMETLFSVGTRIFYQTHFFPLLRLKEQVEEVYFSIRRVDGSELPVLVNAIRREQAGVLVNDCVLMVVHQRSRYEDEILKARRAEEEARLWLSTTLQSIGDAVIATDAEGRVVFTNRIAEELTGWPQGDALGKHLDEVFVIINEETRLPVESPVTKVLREKRVVGLANHTLLIARNGKPIPIDDSGAPIRSGEGEMLGVVLVFRDFTERRRTEQTLRERQESIEALNRHLQRAMIETHHRVKNNLQVIAALVEIQILSGMESVPTTELVRLSHHIRGLAAVHDLLTHQTKAGGEADTLSVRATLDRLLPLLQGITEGRHLNMDVEDVCLPIKQATSLAVLANELVSNSTKHGQGEIGVTFAVVEGRGKFSVWDEGKGFPAGFDPRTSANTGIDLVESIGRHDMQGEVRYENRPEGGALVSISFPLPRAGESEQQP